MKTTTPTTENNLITNEDFDQSLRRLLKNDFEKRLVKNPSFSLRSYAQKLQIDQSLLTKILAGKRSISQINREKISHFLGFNFNSEQSIKKNHSKMIIQPRVSFNFIDDDQFLMISSAHDFALLELMKTRSFVSSVEYVVKKLDISVTEAKLTIERLERLGYISTKKRPWSLLKQNNNWVSGKTTNVARKNLQKKLLEKSIDAIEEIDYQHRIHSSLTVAVNIESIPLIRKKVEEFKAEIAELLDNTKNIDEVYNLSISFFPFSSKSLKESL